MSEPLAQRKRRLYLASLGWTAKVTPDELRRAQAKIRSFRARGMSQAKMCEVTGLLQSTMYGFEKNNGMLRANWEKVMRMPFIPPSGTDLVDSLGSRRRLGSLWRDGFSLPFLAERIGGVERLYLQRMIRGRAGTSPLTSMTAERAQRISELYDKLEVRDPAEFGIDAGASKRAATYAEKRGCVPRHCWDSDTIDDPETIPEWTGACGTPQGLRIHYEQHIPTCAPCLATRDSARKEAGGAKSTFSGSKLRIARVRRGLSITQLGDLLDVHRDAVYCWETGRSAPRTQERVSQLCAILGVPESELTEESA